MPVTDSFVEFVLEQLAPAGPITPKRMFGGVGLYAGDVFFALIAGDVLYLKADDSTREGFKEAGARRFQPYPDRGSGTMRYYSVPAAILEDGDALVAWTKTSVAVARAQRESAQAGKRRARPTPSRKRTGPPSRKRR